MSAIKAAIINVIGDTYENMSIREVMRGSDAILAALDAAGYAVVPKEPTEEMLAEGALKSLTSERHAKRVWEVMLAAAKETT